MHRMFGDIRSVHFVGICGTAMASVAVALKQRGVRVTGSDQQSYPPMSTVLAEAGIEILSGYSETNLEPAPDLVVIGNALSRGNPEVEAVLERKLRYCSLPDLIKEAFIRGKRCVVVAGTHGKTTTTALLAWVLEKGGLNPGFLIGGVPGNFASGARFTDGDWFVIEGDEYDTAFFDKRSKFVHYLPEIGILNNLEFDHADIFPDVAAIQTSFRRFINLVPRNGLLLANGDDPLLAPLLDIEHCPVVRYGFGEKNDYRAAYMSLTTNGSEFEVGDARYSVPMFGELNVRNALAVVLTARHAGLEPEQIQTGFASFKSVRRRMEVRGTMDDVVVIDDFGHHPTAIRETLKALRIRYAGRNLWAVFEPRTNTTRRRVFQNELTEALGLADSVVVAPVARSDKLPADERLDVAVLIRDLQRVGKHAAHATDVDDILRRLLAECRPGDVVCVFSNGGFGGIHQRLLDGLRYRSESTA